MNVVAAATAATAAAGLYIARLAVYISHSVRVSTSSNYKKQVNRSFFGGMLLRRAAAAAGPAPSLFLAMEPSVRRRGRVDRYGVRPGVAFASHRTGSNIGHSVRLH